MTEQHTGEPAAKRPRSRGRKPRRPVSVVGVLGELLITAGVIVLLFLGWQLWFNDIISENQQSNQASGLAQSWALPAAADTATPTPSKTAKPHTEPSTAKPVVGKAPGNAEKFGVLMVPRWGKDWERPIAEGIGVADVLNTIGVGHYPGTQMPGAVGNFAIAAHRLAYGHGFRDVNKLRVGDHIYVETKDGWYSYVFRSLEYVLPTGVGVIDPVPQEPGVKPKDRLITLTTCNPFYSTAERMVAYGVFDGWYPRADGPPTEIASAVAARSS